MAEVVDQLPPRRRLGRQAKYPWDEWLDGQVWKLAVGVDMQSSFVENMRKMCFDAARKRGKKLRTVITEDKKYLFIQAYSKDD